MHTLILLTVLVIIIALFVVVLQGFRKDILEINANAARDGDVAIKVFYSFEKKARQSASMCATYDVTKKPKNTVRENSRKNIFESERAYSPAANF